MCANAYEKLRNSRGTGLFCGRVPTSVAGLLAIEKVPALESPCPPKIGTPPLAGRLVPGLAAMALGDGGHA